MINYNLELNNLINQINQKYIYEILSKENLDTLNKLTLDEAKQLLTSTPVFLGNDIKDFIMKIIPQESDGYLLKVAISKVHNITYPILYNENKEPVKSFSYNNFAITLWHDHTIDLLVNDLFSIFTQDIFNQFVNENLDNIYEELIEYILKIKNNPTIIINLDNEDGLVNTVKKMLINGDLEYSYALSVVDMDMLRDEMMGMAVSMDYYDEFDKLEDDLEECLNKFFKYDDSELLQILVEKEGFKLIDSNKLIK